MWSALCFSIFRINFYFHFFYIIMICVFYCVIFHYCLCGMFLEIFIYTVPKKKSTKFPITSFYIQVGAAYSHIKKKNKKKKTIY